MKRRFFMLLGLTLSASFPIPAPKVVWSGENAICMDVNGFVVMGRHSRKEIPYPPNTIAQHVVERQFWVGQLDSKEGRFIISCSEDARSWETKAIWKLQSGSETRHLLDFLPLDEGRFLLADRNGLGFPVEDDFVPVVVAKADPRGNLRIMRPFDLGVKGPWTVLEGGRRVNKAEHLWVFSALVPGPFVVVDDKYYFSCPRAGMLIEIKANGTAGKTHRLYSELDEKRVRDVEGFEWVVLCAQPRKDGTILIASRSREAVFEGQTLVPRRYTTATIGQHRDRDLMALRLNPKVVWWSFDPRTGKFSEEAPPQRVPSTLKSEADLVNFAFVLDAKGNLHFPYMTGGARAQ